MFRIDRRNVKITEAPANTVIGKKLDKDAAAPQNGEQPFSAPLACEPALTPEQEALLAQQLDAIDAAREDVEKRVREQEQAALKLREQAESELEDAGEKARQITEKAKVEAKEDAEKVIDAAKTMAESIIAAAREKADAEALEIRGQAWKSGFAEGREEAEKLAMIEGERLAAELKIFIDGLHRGREDMVAHFEKDIINLSLAIAKKIVNVAIKKDDIIFEALIKNALNQMKREGKLSIRLSEEDSFRLFSDGSASFVLGGHTVTATVVADPGLKEGDCILESDAEIVDAGVDSQIRAVAVVFDSLGDEP